MLPPFYENRYTWAMQLYDQKNIDKLPWPDTQEGHRAKDFLIPLISKGTHTYIENVKTDMAALTVDNLVLPISINETEWNNSYVCSLYGQYILYAKDEIQQISSPILRKLVSGAVHVLGKALKAGQVNKVVQVNNWLLSTNLYPDLSENQIQKITDFLRKKYPNHALVFRTVHNKQKQLLTALESTGYQRIFSREIFLLDPKDPAVWKERHVKKDLRLLKESAYSEAKPKLEEAQRLANLYKCLNTDKFSAQNPQFKNTFIELALKSDVLTMNGLSSEDSLDGVFGWTSRSGMMVAPFFGYETSLPQDKGLYRQISLLSMLKAKEENLILHMSAGAGSFKKRRKAKAVPEYHMIYSEHLSWARRIPWWILNQISRHVIPRVLKVMH